MKHYTGKTITEILETAATEKNVSPDELVYHTLEEKSGFLGIGTSVTAEVFAPVEVKDFITTYLQTFFNGFELDVNIETTMSGKSVHVSLNSDNNAILIGRNGNSLEGLNTLVKYVSSAEFKRRYFVLIDVNNYKNDRYQKLKVLARRLAKNVQESKISVDLDPMTNDERRLIHQELQAFENIKTQSEGSGRNRHLRILYVEVKE